MIGPACQGPERHFPSCGHVALHLIDGDRRLLLCIGGCSIVVVPGRTRLFKVGGIPGRDDVLAVLHGIFPLPIAGIGNRFGLSVVGLGKGGRWTHAEVVTQLPPAQGFWLRQASRSTFIVEKLKFSHHRLGIKHRLGDSIDLCHFSEKFSKKMIDDSHREHEKLSLHALGRRVRGLREGMGFTQEAFAKRCGISVSFASLLERGERSPSFETLVTIARALDIPLSGLFREGPALEMQDPSHVRLIDFARRAQLSRMQVDRLVAVGVAMFGLGTEGRNPFDDSARCLVEGCARPVLARGYCAPHYHRDRRKRLLDAAER